MFLIAPNQMLAQKQHLTSTNVSYYSSRGYKSKSKGQKYCFLVLLGALEDNHFQPLPASLSRAFCFLVQWHFPPSSELEANLSPVLSSASAFRVNVCDHTGLTQVSRIIGPHTHKLISKLHLIISTIFLSNSRD